MPDSPPPAAGGPLRRRRLGPYLPGWLLLGLAVAVLAGIGARRTPFERLWGDEATYLGMAESLVRDGDLRFGPPDLEWARGRTPEGATLILQRGGDGIAYSKPVLYPLVAAPFLAAFGEAGLPVANAILLAAALGLAWAALARRFEPGRAWTTVATFAGAGAVLPYVLWRMSDALQLALALGGLALACGGLAAPGRGARGRFLEGAGAAAAGGLALGLAAALRPPAGALVAAAVAAQLLYRRPRRAAALLVAAALGLGLAAGANRLATGAAMPYKAVRSSFDSSTGYPVGEGAAAAERFDSARATHEMAARPFGGARARLYSALYFLAGRHTGVVLYFPAALLLAALALARPDRLALALLAGAAAIAVFYLVWLPWNYFGGSTFVGNRYFLVAYAALLPALPRLPSRAALAAVWTVAAVAAGSAALSVAQPGAAEAGSQSHALAGVFRRLPYESTALQIDGQRERSWARDLVRFVDPWPEVRRRGFRLHAGRPPSELLVLTTWPGSPLTLLAVADAPRATLEVTDWRGSDRFLLAPAGRRSRALVELEPSPPWRRHGLGWREGPPLYASVLRLAIRGEGGDGAGAGGAGERPGRSGPGEVAATVYYFGNGRVIRQLVSREVVEVQVPASAAAGSVLRVPVRVRNTGRTTWSSRGDLPVRLGYRLHPPGGGEPIEPPPAALPGETGPGETLATDLEVRLPRRPGRYRLVVDLVAPQVAWFADRTGEPLAEAEIEVTPGG